MAITLSTFGTTADIEKLIKTNPYYRHLSTIKDLLKTNLKYSEYPKIKFEDLMNFSAAFNHVSRSKIGDIRVKYINRTNLVLIDYLILAAACTASRYHPKIWHAITQIDSNYKFYIENSQNRIIDSWIPYIIHQYLFPRDCFGYLSRTNFPISLK